MFEIVPLKEQTPPPPSYLLGWDRAKEGLERAGGRGPLDSGPVLADCQTKLILTSKALKTTERYTNTPDEETKGSI